MSGNTLFWIVICLGYPWLIYLAYKAEKSYQEAIDKKQDLHL